MLFAAVPGVQPVTVIAIVAGASLGMRAGVATGALAAFVSNLFLGQGIWTPQQMLGWGACGAAGALLGPALRNRWMLAAVSAVLGFAFSASMDVWLWYGFAPHTLPSLVAVVGRGLWFDASHAAGQRRDRAGGRAGAAADARPLRLATPDGGRVGLTPLLAAASARRLAGVLRAGRMRPDGALPSRAAPTDALLTSWAVLGPARGRRRLAGLARRTCSRRRRRCTRRTTSRSSRWPSRPSARRNESLLARLRSAGDRADRRDAQLDVLGGARARALDARDDEIHARSADEGGRIRVVQERPGRLERHGGGARGAPRRRRPRRAGHCAQPGSCARSSDPTAASSSRAAAAPTPSRPRGRSRASSRPARSRRALHSTIWPG